MRARFLARHDIPAPALLAATEHGSLVEFVDGEVLGDLIDAGRDTEPVWRLVGAAYRRVHAVAFPAGLTADRLGPGQFVFTADDPVARLHAQIHESESGLRRVLPGLVAHLPRLHEMVDSAAPPLRAAPSALGHGDIHMWNVIVGPDRATLIDWDAPRAGDPAKELALLHKHASLFNRLGLPAAFFDGYASHAPEPNTSIHRIVQTLYWATSDDFAQTEADPLLSADLKRRHASWLPILLDHVRQLPDHLDRLRALIR